MILLDIDVDMEGEMWYDMMGICDPTPSIGSSETHPGY